VIGLVVLAAAAVLRWGLPWHGGGTADLERGSSTEATVVRVVDGDTIRVSIRGRVERVRYIGIDTPESVRPGSPVECFAKRASEFNRRLVDRRRVVLRTDAELRDRYGRMLAYVYRRDDGLFVNLDLVRRGFATILTIPPNVAHAQDFVRAERAARREGAGLWHACA
jgi:micrococcal nuclease